MRSVGAALAALGLVVGLLGTAVVGSALALFGTDIEPSASPAATAGIPPAMLTLYQQAAATCPGLPWTVLAAIGTVESDNGRSTLPGVHSGANAAGAEGPMQFEPATFSFGDGAWRPRANYLLCRRNFRTSVVIGITSPWRARHRIGCTACRSVQDLREAVWVVSVCSAVAVGDDHETLATGVRRGARGSGCAPSPSARCVPRRRSVGLRVRLLHNLIEDQTCRLGD